MFKPSPAAGRAGTGTGAGGAGPSRLSQGPRAAARCPSPPVSPGIYFRGEKQAWLALSAGMTREPNKGAFEIVRVGGVAPLPLHAAA